MVKPYDQTAAASSDDSPAMELFPPAIEAWLQTPFEVHVARWKREIAEGLRDADGLWIADPSRRPRHSAESYTL